MCLEDGVGEMALWQTHQQRWEDVEWELRSPVPAGPRPQRHKGGCGPAQPHLCRVDLRVKRILVDFNEVSLQSIKLLSYLGKVRYGALVRVNLLGKLSKYSN